MWVCVPGYGDFCLPWSFAFPNYKEEPVVSKLGKSHLHPLSCLWPLLCLCFVPPHLGPAPVLIPCPHPWEGNSPCSHSAEPSQDPTCHKALGVLGWHAVEWGQSCYQGLPRQLVPQLWVPEPGPILSHANVQRRPLGNGEGTIICTLDSILSPLFLSPHPASHHRFLRPPACSVLTALAPPATGPSTPFSTWQLQGYFLLTNLSGSYLACGRPFRALLASKVSACFPRPLDLALLSALKFKPPGWFLCSAGNRFLCLRAFEYAIPMGHFSQLFTLLCPSSVVLFLEPTCWVRGQNLGLALQSS